MPDYQAELAVEIIRVVHDLMHKYRNQSPEIFSELSMRLGEDGDNPIAVARSLLGSLSVRALMPSSQDILEGVNQFNKLANDQPIERIELFNHVTEEHTVLVFDRPRQEYLDAASERQVRRCLDILAVINDKDLNPGGDRV